MDGCRNEVKRQAEKNEAPQKRQRLREAPSLEPGASVTKEKPGKQRVRIPDSKDGSDNGNMLPLIRGVEKLIPDILKKGQ